MYSCDGVVRRYDYTEKKIGKHVENTQQLDFEDLRNNLIPRRPSIEIKSKKKMYMCVVN